MSIQIDREIQNKTREATQLLQSFCMMDAVKTPVFASKITSVFKESGGEGWEAVWESSRSAEYNSSV